jgi:ABC-type transport system substrate-binding protein
MDLFQTWHSSQADVPKGSNRVGFRNKEADTIIEKLRETFDMQERIRLLRSFHRIVHEEQPYSFFMVEKRIVCWWSDVKNVVFPKYLRPELNFMPWWVDKAL